MRVWCVLVLMFFSSTAWSENDPHWRFVVYELNDQAAQFAEEKYSAEQKEKGFVRLGSEFKEDFDALSPKMLKKMGMPGEHFAQLLLDTTILAMEEKSFSIKPSRESGEHFMRRVPESDPARFTLHQMPEQPPLQIKFEWDETMEQAQNNSEAVLSYSVKVALTRSGVVERQTVSGTSLPVGEPTLETGTVEFETSIQLNSGLAHLVFVSNMKPLLFILQTMRTTPEELQQYSLESRCFRIEGLLEKPEKINAWLPLNRSKIVDGAVISFLADATYELQAAKAPSLKQIGDLGDTSLGPEPRFYHSKKTKEEYIAKKRAIRKTLNSIHGFRRVDLIELVSAPRVTNIINRSDVQSQKDEVLFKMVIAGDGGVLNSSDASPDSDKAFRGIFDDLGKYHEWFQEYDVGDHHIQVEKHFAAIADVTKRSVKVNSHPEKSEISFNEGMYFVNRVSATEYKGYYITDFFFLKREHKDLPNSIEDTPEARAALEDGVEAEYFRCRYLTTEEETAGFLYSVSDSEHYLIFNTITLIDP